MDIEINETLEVDFVLTPIIKASKILWYSLRPPQRDIFNNKDISRAEGKLQLLSRIPPIEAAKT